MADLEELGFVSARTTSPGGCRRREATAFFVDTLMTVRPLEAEQTQLMEGQMLVAEPQRAIQTAAQLLSSLSRSPGSCCLRAVPRPSATSNSCAFPTVRTLMIVVSPEGDVHNRILITSGPYSQAELIEAGNVLNQRFAGLSFEQRAPPCAASERAAPGNGRPDGSGGAGRRRGSRTVRPGRDFGRTQPARVNIWPPTWISWGAF